MKRKIKAMNLIWSMGDGGAQQILINYLRFFKDDPDIDFHLFVYDSPTDSKYDKEIREKKYNVTYLNGPHPLIEIPYLKRFYGEKKRYESWFSAIKQYNPDIVHVHISALLASVLKPIVDANIPVRFDTLHSDPRRYTGKQLEIIKKAFNTYDFIPICVNEQQYELAKDHYGIKDHDVIYNGVNFSSLDASRIAKDKARSQLQIASNEYVVLGVGRLDPVKNFNLLIQSFSFLHQKKSNSSLYIAGAGKELSNLKKLAKTLNVSKNVHFLGDVNDIALLYCAADVIGITSVSESASLVLLEAQNFNLKCVISSGVPTDSVISNTVIQMKENSTAEEWANEMLYGSDFVTPSHSKNEYEVNNTCMKLKKIYLKRFVEYEKKISDNN